MLRVKVLKKQSNLLFRAKSAVAEKLAPLAQFADDCQEAYNEFKVYSKMSPTLSKVSKKVRKDKETSKSLDILKDRSIARDKLLDDLLEKGESIDIENYDLIDFNINNL